MNVEEFYTQPERASSNELAFGSTWRAHGQGPWKLVWLESTGELAAFEEIPPEPYVSQSGSGGGLIDLPFSVAIEGVAEVIRRAEKRQSKPLSYEVVVVGVEPDVERLQTRLTGWEEHIAEDNGLAWVAGHFDLPRADGP
jgi:hypothetical protein